MKRRTGRRAGASPNAAGGGEAALQETTGEEPWSSRGGRRSPGSWVSRIVKSPKLPWFRKASGLLRFHVPLRAWSFAGPDRSSRKRRCAIRLTGARWRPRGYADLRRRREPGEPALRRDHGLFALRSQSPTCWPTDWTVSPASRMKPAKRSA